MKIRLMVGAEKYAEVARELAALGVELDDSAELVLSERGAYPSFIIGRRDGELFRLPAAEISHIESLSHEITAHTDSGSYRLVEALKRLETLLDPAEFIRVSNSFIVSAGHIKSIRPAVTMKFVLTMRDGSRVDVTRSYYYIFKDFLGI